MNNKHISAFLAALSLAAFTVSCETAHTSSESPAASAAVSQLSDEESRMLDMLVRLADSQSAPLRLTSWIRGSLSDSSEAHLLNREAGYDLECIEFTSAGEIHYASAAIGELSVSGESELKLIISSPGRFLSSPEIHSQASIQRINAALEARSGK